MSAGTLAGLGRGRARFVGFGGFGRPLGEGGGQHADIFNKSSVRSHFGSRFRLELALAGVLLCPALNGGPQLQYLSS